MRGGPGPRVCRRPGLKRFSRGLCSQAHFGSPRRGQANRAIRYRHQQLAGSYLRLVPFTMPAHCRREMITGPFRNMPFQGGLSLCPHRTWANPTMEMTMAQNQSSGRGFAAMDENRQREIAAKGGHESGGNFRNDPQRASEAAARAGTRAAATSRTTANVLPKPAARAASTDLKNKRKAPLLPGPSRSSFDRISRTTGTGGHRSPLWWRR